MQYLYQESHLRLPTFHWCVSLIIFCSPGFQQTQGPSGARQAAFGAPRRPPRPVPIPQLDEAVQPSKEKPKVPVLEKHLIDQLSTEEQDSLNTKFQEATDAEKKVDYTCSFKFSYQF